MNQSALISDEQIETFRRDGAVLIKGLLSPEWLATMSEVCDQARANAADNTGYYGDDKNEIGETLTADDNFLVIPEMLRFLRESPAARVAAEAIGSKYAQLYEDLLIYKAAGTAAPTPWHQDEPQWPVSGFKMASTWFSLEATTPETGALQFLAGSHKGPLYVPYLPDWQMENLKIDRHLFAAEPMPEVDPVRDADRIRSFSTEPGDVILFHPRTIHAAFGNHSARPRRTFTIRFLGDDIRWQPKACVYHAWLRDIDLPAGGLLEHERFPMLWSLEQEAA